VTPRKIAAFAIGPIGAAVLGLISLPIITWLFSQEDVGRMAMLQVTLSFSILLFSLGLDQSYVREFHEAENKPALLKRAMLPGLLLLLIAIGVLLSFGGSMASFEELGVYSVAISFAAAAVILQSIFSNVWAPTVSKWAGNSVALAEKIDMQRPRVSGCCGYLCGMG